jgi:hypothetical protein
MKCPNCGTYNPDEREICWRCDKPLPKLEPQKKRDPQQSARIWLYVAIAVFVIFTLARTCGAFGSGNQAQPQGPTGYVPQPPAVAYQMPSPWTM